MKEYNNKFHFNNVFHEKRSFGGISLIQIGDLHCQGDSVIPEHKQECYEITYVISGKGICITNGKKIPLEKGMIYVSLSDDYHSIISDSVEPLRYFFLGFELMISHPLYSYLKQFSEKLRDEHKRIKKDSFGINDNFVKCLSEFARRSDFSDFLIESHLNQIIAYTFQNFNLQEYGYSPKVSDKETLVYNIINHVENNLLSIKSVDDIIKAFSYSASHISHVFSQYMGKSLNQYLKSAKLEKALYLIKSNNNSITEISELLGYASVHAFSRAFKKRYYVSPSTYLDRN